MKTKEDWLTLTAVAPVIIAITIVASFWPIALPIVIAAVTLLVIAARKPNTVAPVMVLTALPFMRPNIFGEFYSFQAMLICVAAGFISFLADGAKLRVPKSYMVVTAMAALLYVWLLINASIFGSDFEASLWQGFMITVVTVLSIGLVVADPKRRRIVVRGFVSIVIVLSASFVVTFAVWLVAGIGALPITTFSPSRVGDLGAGTVFFPFTPAFGTQTISGITFPRFTGLGREPGWMALYCGLALLLWGRVGRPRIVGRLVLLAGLLGAFSTAGFGAFAVALIVAWIGRRPKSKDIAVQFFVLILKIAALGAALWVAINAPVFGIASKGDLNPISLQERTNATNAGLSAILNSPFGGVHTGIQEAINLVAALAPFGVPFALIVIAAVIMPRIGHPEKGLTTAPILLIFVTLLLSQPISDSTLVFAMIGLVYASALPDMTALNIGIERPDWVGTSRAETPSPVYCGMGVTAESHTAQ